MIGRHRSRPKIDFVVNFQHESKQSFTAGHALESRSFPNEDIGGPDEPEPPTMALNYQLIFAASCRYRGRFVGPVGPLEIVPKSRLLDEPLYPTSKVG